MKFIRILVALLLVIALPLPAFAQGGPSWAGVAPVAGTPVCSLNVLGGQLNSCGTGTIPVVTGTGSPSITAGSTDVYGEVTAGASATSVVITFSSTKGNAPFCLVKSQTQLAAWSYTISTTAITITQTATSGNKIDYFCAQH